MHPSERPEVIFWTGDSTPHDIWNQTIHKNIMYTIEISKFLDDNLPNIPVVAVPGNHEFYPVNVMEFDDDNDVVLNKIGDQWKEWFTPESQQLFKTKGYFSQILEHPKLKNTRVIGLNTQACNNMNWHIWHTMSDPQDHIQWIENELIKAEKANEKVMIMGHIPNNDEDCLNDYSIRFKALAERYQHVIRGFYYGHTHMEEMGINHGFDLQNPL